MDSTAAQTADPLAAHQSRLAEVRRQRHRALGLVLLSVPVGLIVPWFFVQLIARAQGACLDLDAGGRFALSGLWLLLALASGGRSSSAAWSRGGSPYPPASLWAWPSCSWSASLRRARASASAVWQTTPPRRPASAGRVACQRGGRRSCRTSSPVGLTRGRVRHCPSRRPDGWGRQGSQRQEPVGAPRAGRRNRSRRSFTAIVRGTSSVK